MAHGLQLRLNCSEVNDTARSHQPFMIFDALEQDFRSTLYIDYMVSKELNQHLDIVHTKYHHPPRELALSMHESVDLENILCNLVLVELE